jgi:hypothetical protein
MNSSPPSDAAHLAAELNEALARLETALLTPLVSGELGSWARTAQEAMETLSQRLPSYLKSVLHPEFAEIAKSDPELLSKIEQLIADDQNVVLEQDAFRSRLSDFVKRTAEVQKDEARLAAERTRLEQEGIALILRIKRQRVAADTWLAEATYRDRGSVD